jgi:hypothetical protein
MSIYTFFSVPAMLLFSISALAETRVTPLLRCSSNLVGAPAFSVDFVEPTVGFSHYRIAKTPLHPFVDPSFLDIKMQDVVLYGDTLIITVNQGRSGYAHIYSTKNLTLIDINLFQQPSINTDGPVTSYSCALQ